MSRPDRPQATRRKRPTYRPKRIIACGKTRYQDADGARDALARIARIDDSDHRPVRAYPCPRCRGWHLTSSTSKRGD